MELLAYLGGDDQIIPLPAILLDSLAHNCNPVNQLFITSPPGGVHRGDSAVRGSSLLTLFALAIGINLGGVEEVDAAVVSGLHASEGSLCTQVS